uniref:Uncharacterized protein n=1 Tax=Arundo donax TaxID=35708 RepID=A0A0A8YL64_ARUDO
MMSLICSLLLIDRLCCGPPASPCPCSSPSLPASPLQSAAPSQSTGRTARPDASPPDGSCLLARPGDSGGQRQEPLAPSVPLTRKIQSLEDLGRARPSNHGGRSSQEPRRGSGQPGRRLPREECG